MKIYIDDDYRCHLTDNGTMREIETDFFEGKCQRFIEGYRYIPEGESWTRKDGKVFTGELIAPWRDYNILAELQAQHEETQTELADKTAALAAIYSGEVET